MTAEQQEKAILFAQYFNQTVWKDERDDTPRCVGYEMVNILTIHDHEYLLLTPLSMIIDEDFIGICKIVCRRHNKHYEEKHISYNVVNERNAEVLINNWPRINIQITIDGIDFQYRDTRGEYKSCYLPSQWHVTDFLRSRGYALPYMGISVEEQVSRGWIKLK